MDVLCQRMILSRVVHRGCTVYRRMSVGVVNWFVRSVRTLMLKIKIGIMIKWQVDEIERTVDLNPKGNRQ